MQLTPEWRTDLLETVVRACPGPDLERLLVEKLGMNPYGLGPHATYAELVDGVIRWAEETGRLDELLHVLFTNRPQEPLFLQLAELAGQLAKPALAVGTGDAQAAFTTFQHALNAVPESLTGAFRRAAAADFYRLSRAARRERWTDATPVPPSFFGPLWPEGEPEELTREPLQPALADGSPPVGFTLRHRLAGHNETITRLAWSPDGALLASASFDGTVRVWDAESGQCAQIFSGHLGCVFAVAWSPDGRTVATGGEDSTVGVWDLLTGKRLRTLTGHANTVCAVAYSPDGATLASGSFDKAIHCWRMPEGELRNVFLRHSSGVNDVAWSPDTTSPILCSGSVDRTLILWDGSSPTPLRTLHGHTNDILSVAWSPDGSRIASASSDWTVRLWSAASGEAIATLAGHKGLVSWACFSADGELLASKSGDGTVRLWQASSGAQVATLPEANAYSWPRGIAFHPKAPDALATLGENNRGIRIWQLDRAVLLGTQPAR